MAWNWLYRCRASGRCVGPGLAGSAARQGRAGQGALAFAVCTSLTSGSRQAVLFVLCPVLFRPDAFRKFAPLPDPVRSATPDSQVTNSISTTIFFGLEGEDGGGFGGSLGGPSGKGSGADGPGGGYGSRGHRCPPHPRSLDSLSDWRGGLSRQTLRRRFPVPRPGAAAHGVPRNGGSGRLARNGGPRPPTQRP